MLKGTQWQCQRHEGRAEVLRVTGLGIFYDQFPQFRYILQRKVFLHTRAHSPKHAPESQDRFVISSIVEGRPKSCVGSKVETLVLGCMAGYCWAESLDEELL